MNEQGYCNFQKEILTTWTTRTEALQEEIRLHNLNDVAKNPTFYNRSKQTSTGFDTTGVSVVHSEETKNKISTSQIGKKIKATSIQKLKETINSENWKNTIGVEQSAKQKATKNNLLWKNTKGIEQSLRISESKKGKTKGGKNPAAKNIIIYDNNGVIKYNTFGTLKVICLENNIPFHAIKQSYLLGGKPLYGTKISNNRANKNGNFIYIGWYAKIV